MTTATTTLAMARRRRADPTTVLTVLWLGALVVATWFAPQDAKYHAHLSHLYTLFHTTSVKGLTLQYMQWLGWTLFVVTAVLAVVGALFANQVSYDLLG